MHAASKDGARPNINGVNFGKDGSAGTNGHVLAMVRNEEGESMLPDGEEPVTVPLDVVTELAKASKKGGGDIELELVGGIDAVVRHAGRVRSFEGVGDTYPNVDHVLPKGEPEFVVGIGIEVLETLIKVARHYTGERQRILEFRFTDNLSVFDVKVQGADDRLRLVGMPARVK